MVVDGDGVGEAIGPDGVWPWIVDAYAADRRRGERQGSQFPEALDRLRRARRRPRHDTAQGHAVHDDPSGEPAGELRRGAIEPREGRDVGLAQDAPAIGQTEVRVGITDVEKQEHGGENSLKGFFRT